MKLRLALLLLLTLIQAEIVTVFSIPNNGNEVNAVISKSEDIDAEFPDNVTHPIEAYLPPHYDDFVNVKNRKTVRKRSAGRTVNIPSHIVDSMANTPVADLSGNLPNIQKMILDSHNKYRRQASPTAKNMLKMVWSPEAAKTAGDWARKCQPGHSLQNLRVIPRFKCGENIFLSNDLVPWYTVVDAWYSECVDYTYGIGALLNKEVGHYTQVMWASSYLIGCDMAECSTGNNKYIYVCHCCPAGNKGSKLYPWKKGKTCEDCPKSCEDKLCTNPCPYQDFFNNCWDFQTKCGGDPKLYKSDCPGTCQCTKGEIK